MPQSPTKKSSDWLPAHSAPLTRELLAADRAANLLHQDGPKVRLLSDAEREASLAEFMVTRPSGNLWIFAYGSLVWNPAIRFEESRVADIQGWHRAFCLSTPVGRGTPQQPGLVLGLERGGACRGVAYRIAERAIASELSILWSREMLMGGYKPIWVDLIGEDGKKFGVATSFAIDANHEQYAGDLPHDEKIRRLSIARGSWGSSADYLFRTIQALRKHGIRDEEMERFGSIVGKSAGKNLREAA
jgi:glutathione-specific gamma-glutamylcyclotransferase